MQLSRQDLQQLNASTIDSLSWNEGKALILKLVADLIEAHDRLNQNSQNSSRPPSSETPWQTSAETDNSENKHKLQFDQDTDEGEPSASKPRKVVTTEWENQGKPGRKPGMAGHGQTVDLPITGRVPHYPEQCGACSRPLEPERFVARNGCYVLDLVRNTNVLIGLEVTHVLNIYGDIDCDCGHVNRTELGRCADETEWKAALTEWRLIGPTLATLIVCLSLRMHSSRALIQEFLNHWFGVYLSTSTINQCIHEAGRAVAPLEEQLADEVNQADLLHADETTWKESAQLLWLWVFSSSTVTLYVVGRRSKEIIQNLLALNLPVG